MTATKKSGPVSREIGFLEEISKQQLRGGGLSPGHGRIPHLLLLARDPMAERLSPERDSFPGGESRCLGPSGP